MNEHVEAPRNVEQNESRIWQLSVLGRSIKKPWVGKLQHVLQLQKQNHQNVKVAVLNVNDLWAVNNVQPSTETEKSRVDDTGAVNLTYVPHLFNLMGFE